MLCLDKSGYLNYLVVSINVSELGISKGYLYYTLPEDQSLYMFDVEDKCTMTSLPCSKLPTSWFSSQWIMMPQPTVSEDDNENRRKKQKMENLDEPRPWMVINDDIVASIASHLHPVDFLHFRAVCKATKLPIVKQISGAMRSTYLTPWLLYSTENATRNNFVDPMHNNEKYLMNLPELLAGAVVRCQKGGWLLISKGRFTLFFYNPFTKETIQLPALQSGCCFADDRWIFLFFENSDLEKFMPTFNEPVFHKGFFYCVDFNGTLGVFNEASWKVLNNPHGYSNAAYVSFLVE
ncbi:hypothetical protein MKW98_008585, partial [Papaver atlanticum]